MGPRLSSYCSLLRREGVLSKKVQGITKVLIQRGDLKLVQEGLAHILLDVVPAVPKPSPEDYETAKICLEKAAHDLRASVVFNFCPSPIIVERGLELWLQSCREVEVVVTYPVSSPRDEERNARCAVASQELLNEWGRIFGYTAEELHTFLASPKNTVVVESAKLEQFLVRASRIAHDALEDPNTAIRERRNVGPQDLG